MCSSGGTRAWLWRAATPRDAQPQRVAEAPPPDRKVAVSRPWRCGQWIFDLILSILVPGSTGRYNRQGRKANVGAGTATATEPTREHKQYATQGPTTYLCT